MGIIIGLDIGIASVGIAVVDKDTLDIKCVVSDLFDSADASKNIERRNNRQARRLNRRRKTRIGDFNTLWVSMFGELPEEVDSNVLLLRNAGLDEQLTLDEIYCVLKYMLKHRGISYLEDALNEENVTGSYQKGIAINQRESEYMLPCEIQLERFRKYGQYRGDCEAENENGEKITLSNVFMTNSYRKEIDKFLNTQGKYGILNQKFIDEYLKIFNRKRKYYEGPGNEKSRTDYGKYTTGKDLDGKYITEKNIFEKLIGKCSVYKEELRAAGASYTAQEFNILNDLNNITVNNKKLTTQQKKDVIEIVQNSDRINMEKIISSCIGEKIEKIEGARIDKNEKNIYHTFEQYNKMRKIFAEKNYDIKELTIEQLDEIGRILTINTEREGIKDAIMESELLHLNNEQINLLIELRYKNSSLFTKWQSLSIKAMREIIPDLYDRNVNQMNILAERGVFKDKINLFENSVYLPKEPVLEEIYNPVVRRSISMTIDALNALIKKYGYPEDIVIEMPRDRNDSEQKDRIKKFQKTRENELKNIKKKIKEEYGIEITDEYFRKHKGLELELKLWVEQNEKCPYSGKYINVQDILYHHELFEIDHIIPLSISYDDSRNNKVLVYKEENQDKGNRTPLMYLSTVNRQYDQHEFMNYVLSTKTLPRKKRELLLNYEDITKIDVLKGFINRNLNDTRYASRSVLNAIQLFFGGKECDTKVRVIRGAVTNQLRIKLNLPKDREKSYSHHAIDAAIMCYSQMGLMNFRNIQNKFIDFENETYLSDERDSCFDNKYYDEALFGQVLKMRKNLLKAEGKPQRSVQSKGVFDEEEKNNGIVRYHHKVDKKPNRGLSNASIYGTRKIDDKIYKIVGYDIRNNKDAEAIINIIKKGKSDNFLMAKHDPETFKNLMEIYEQYKEEKNPFLAYEQETGDYIRKYAKNHNGPIIKKIKYVDSEVGSCIDISANYGYKNGDKRVIMDTLTPYRADVYYNYKDGTYRIIGVKYADFKYSNAKYVLDEEAYALILIKEGLLKIGDSLENISSSGYEYRLSFYKNDIIEYTKNDIVYKERFLSRTMPKVKNYIETKPISAALYEKRNPIGLTNATNICKIYTDVLGNETKIYKEKFKLSVD